MTKNSATPVKQPSGTRYFQLFNHPSGRSGVSGTDTGGGGGEEEADGGMGGVDPIGAF